MLSRELTTNEKSQIRRSVIKRCACYDREYGCLPLDSNCYMMTIGFNDSKLCRYYEKCILPIESEILSFLKIQTGVVKNCKYCGVRFLALGNHQYCSDYCSLMARRRGAVRRMRKSRDKQLK